jgi:hypothetical protein
MKKKPQGRPPKAEQELRRTGYRVTFTDVEASRLRELAGKQSIASYMRERSLESR